MPFGLAFGKDPIRTGVNPVYVVELTGRCVWLSSAHVCWAAGVIVILCLFLLWPLFLFFPVMGQTQVTPRSLILDHFSAVREKAHTYGLEVRKGKFNTLCSSEWPGFDVGWPPQGTFLLRVIKQVRKIITQPGLQGHPDQYPYIIM